MDQQDNWVTWMGKHYGSMAQASQSHEVKPDTSVAEDPTGVKRGTGADSDSDGDTSVSFPRRGPNTCLDTRIHISHFPSSLTGLSHFLLIPQRFQTLPPAPQATGEHPAAQKIKREKSSSPELNLVPSLGPKHRGDPRTHPALDPPHPVSVSETSSVDTRLKLPPPITRSVSVVEKSAKMTVPASLATPGGISDPALITYVHRAARLASYGSMLTGDLLASSTSYKMSSRRWESTTLSICPRS